METIIYSMGQGGNIAGIIFILLICGYFLADRILSFYEKKKANKKEIENIKVEDFLLIYKGKYVIPKEFEELKKGVYRITFDAEKEL